MQFSIIYPPNFQKKCHILMNFSKKMSWKVFKSHERMVIPAQLTSNWNCCFLLEPEIRFHVIKEMYEALCMYFNVYSTIAICYLLSVTCYLLLATCYCLLLLRDDLRKKNGKKDDIVQKGGRGLGQNHHF